MSFVREEKSLADWERELLGSSPGMIFGTTSPKTPKPNPGDQVQISYNGTVETVTSSSILVKVDGGKTHYLPSRPADKAEIVVTKIFKAPKWGAGDVVYDTVEGTVYSLPKNAVSNACGCSDCQWQVSGSSVRITQEEFLKTVRQDKVILLVRNGKRVSGDLLNRF